MRLACLLYCNDLDSFVETVELFGVSAAAIVAMTFSVSIFMYMFVSAVAQVALWEGV